MGTNGAAAPSGDPKDRSKENIVKEESEQLVQASDLEALNTEIDTAIDSIRTNLKNPLPASQQTQPNSDNKSVPQFEILEDLGDEDNVHELSDEDIEFVEETPASVKTESNELVSEILFDNAIKHRPITPDSDLIPEGVTAMSGNAEGQINIETKNAIFAVKTVRGPKAKNDDGFMVHADSNLLVVEDGVGSSGTGEVAANLFNYSGSRTVIENPNVSLDELINTSHKYIRAFQAQNDGDKGLRRTSTTLTAARIGDDKMIELANAGDSPGIIIRGERIIESTEDDSLMNYLTNQRGLSEEEAKEFCEEIDQDPEGVMIAAGHFDFKDTIISNDRVKKVQGQKGDIVLLCSDGLTKAFTKEEIAQFLHQRVTLDKIPLDQAITEMVDAAEAKMRKGKSSIDNIVAGGIVLK